MLDSQMVSISLAQGIDTKTDPKQVTSEYLLIQNAIYQTLQQLNLRSGFTAISNATYAGGTITAGYGIAALNQSLLEHDGISVYSRTNDVTAWTQVGQKRAITVTRQTIGSFSSPNYVSLGMARASNGIELYVWIDRNGQQFNNDNSLDGPAYYSAFDTNNNVTLTSGTIGTYKNVRVDVIGANFFITVTDGTAISVLRQPTATPNFSTATLHTLAALAFVTKIDTFATSSALYILGGPVYKVDPVTFALTSSAVTTYGPPPNAGFTYDAVQNNIWIAHYSGTNVQAAVLDQNLNVVAALQTVLAAGTTPVQGAMVLYASNNQGYIMAPSSVYNLQLLTKTTLTGAAFTSVASSNLLSNGQIASKPTVLSDGFIYYASSFITAENPTSGPQDTLFNPTQPTSFLLKFNPALIGTGSPPPIVVAKFLALETGLPYSFQTTGGTTVFVFYTPNALIQIDANNFSLPGLQTTQDVAAASLSGTIIMPSATIVKTNFQFLTKFRRNALANNIQTTGGYVSSYDENIEVEQGFHLYPEVISVTLTAPGGANVPIGTYAYAFLYRWNDSLGQIQRSAPYFLPQTVVVTANNTRVTFGLTPLSLTDKSNYYIDIYRTDSNGTIYKFVRSILVQPDGTILNGGGIYDQSFSPSLLQLYTTGGEVPNIPAPATSFITDFKNRPFVIPSEEPLSIWYGKQVLPNFPVEFAQEFVINLEARGGNATALAPLDDKLIIFKQNALFYMVGDGPSPSGVNNDFSYPQIIPSDSGCLEPDSVVSFPNGVCFKGAKGIYLLDRSLKVAYIGAAVEAYNQYQITSAVVDYNLQLIRYTLSNGMCLVYDYFVEKWSTFSNISAVDSVICNGIYYYLKSSGIVEQETPGVCNDDGSAISMSMTTGWLSFAKIQGFERIRKFLLLGNNYTPSNISISFAYDFNPAVFQTITITNPALEDPWEYEVQPMRQKCTSMQLTFTITPTGTPGKALSLSGIALEVGVKRGENKLPAAKSVG